TETEQWQRQRRQGQSQAAGRFSLPVSHESHAMLGSHRPALNSMTYDVDDFAAAQELFHSNGWTDGLPVVPPTEDAVEACLEWVMMPADTLICIAPEPA